ncbi:MAG TPA: SDR family oxidoreductase [Jatrophihabitantaceae bacterium]|jgi:3-oxoacyl-[acyl-carrier protein] reductase
MSRHVLVTGASGGIGLAVAERFARAGDEVVVTARRPEPLAAAADKIGARALPADLTDPEQVAALVDRLPEHLDVLVNNAGGNRAFDRAEPADLSELAELWRTNLEANLISAVLVTEAVRARLRAGGSVIHLGSIGAERGAGSYGAAKAALASWSVGLSAELGPRGVTSNVISPGYIEQTEFFRDRMTDARRAALVAATHDGRPGTADDIAATAYFLASAGARHVTGQLLNVNGGAFTTR